MGALCRFFVVWVPGCCLLLTLFVMLLLPSMRSLPTLRKRRTRVPMTAPFFHHSRSTGLRRRCSSLAMVVSLMACLWLPPRCGRRQRGVHPMAPTGWRQCSLRPTVVERNGTENEHTVGWIGPYRALRLANRLLFQRERSASKAPAGREKDQAVGAASSLALDSPCSSASPRLASSSLPRVLLDPRPIPQLACFPSLHFLYYPTNAATVG